MTEVLIGFALAAVGWALAAAGWMGWWQERDRRRALERSGPYQPKAVHRPSDSAEAKAKREMRQLETETVQKLADELQEEAKSAGINASRKEIEDEARRMIHAAGTGRPL